MAPQSAASATSTTSHSSTRMRTLVRWSDSSLSMTTPRPEKAEPSRRMARTFLHRLFGLVFEIAGVDRFEARLLDAEIFEAALHRDHLGRGLRAHVAIGVQPKFSNPGFLDAADPWNERQPLGQSGAIGLDVDDIAAAENLPAEIGPRRHQCDLARTEQGDAVANALHPLEQM